MYCQTAPQGKPVQLLFPHCPPYHKHGCTLHCEHDHANMVCDCISACYSGDLLGYSGDEGLSGPCRQAKDGIRWREGAAGVAASHEVAEPGGVEGQQRRNAGARVLK